MGRPKSTNSTCPSETLKEWLTRRAGEVVQIGTEHGSGMLYAGKAGGYTLEAMRSAYHMPFGDLPVLEEYPSMYAGYIGIIPGGLYGKAELPRELVPKSPEPPLENYIRFADRIVANIVRDYKSALYAKAIGHAGHGIDGEIIQGEAAIRSESFAILSNADGEDLLRLIRRQVKQEAEDYERKRNQRRHSRLREDFPPDF